jgi:hypothetical protein
MESVLGKLFLLTLVFIFLWVAAAVRPSMFFGPFWGDFWDDPWRARGLARGTRAWLIAGFVVLAVVIVVSGS